MPERCLVRIHHWGPMPAKIIPFSDQHAIRNVLFVIEFSRPVTAVELSELKPGMPLHDALKGALPKVTEQQQVVINLGPGVPGFPNAAVPQELGGISFERMLPNGEPEIGLNIQAGSLSLICGKYSRWAEVLGKVEEILNLVSGWLGKHKVQASSFVLQYLDEFKVFFEGGQYGPLAELFKTTSPYITSNFANLDGAFHSHHGFFSSPDYEIPGRLLTNINVNVAELAGFLNAQVQTTHKYIAHEHIKIAGEDGFSQTLKDAYEYLHQDNKKIMRSLLTEPVKAMISFDRETGRA